MTLSPNHLRRISHHSFISKLQRFQQHPISRDFKVFSAESIDELMRHANARFIPFFQNQCLINRAQEKGKLSTLAFFDWEQLLSRADRTCDEIATLLIGVVDAEKVAYFIVPVENSESFETETMQFKQLRSVLPFLSEEDVALLAQGKMLLQWSENNQFCGRCGSKTVLVQNSNQSLHRSCTNCSTTVYPRVDPVVITLVVDAKNKRCLLGRKAIFPKGMYSALAGFVEPGESLERAVQREVFEEANVVVDRDQIEFIGSQSWPLSNRTAELMIGCLAFIDDAEEQTIRTEDELEDAKWFSLDEVRVAVKDNEQGPARESSVGFNIPASYAMAWNLMHTWVTMEDEIARKAKEQMEGFQKSLL